MPPTRCRPILPGELEAAGGDRHGQSGIADGPARRLLFIASEVMFFGGLFATYFNGRASVPAG